MKEIKKIVHVSERVCRLARNYIFSILLFYCSYMQKMIFSRLGLTLISELCALCTIRKCGTTARYIFQLVLRVITL